MEYFILNVSTGVVTVLLGFIFVWFYKNRRSSYGLPPGPPNIPLLGSLPFLGPDIREPLRKMAEKYGDVMTVYLGTRRIVILNTYDVIREAFVKRGYSFAGRPQDLFLMSELCGSIGIISSQGDLWYEQRRFTHTVLKDLGMGRGILEPKILEEIEHFIRVLDDLEGAPIHPIHVTMRAVANIIHSILHGNRCNYDNKEFNAKLSRLEFACESLANSSVVMALPFLRYLPGDLFSIKRLLADSQTGTKEALHTIQNMKAAYDSNNVECFIDNYIKRMKEYEGDPNSSFTDKQLAQVMGDLFGAGTETTSNTFMWCLVHMLLNPIVMRRCQQEIDVAISRDSMPSMSDRVKLPYVEATLLEVHRIASITPFGVPHTTVKDVWLRGYRLPRGTEVMPNMYAVHRHPVTWPEPELFNPERHLTEDGRVIRSEQLIPFSIGRRVCLGESLARMELFLLFTSVLQKYDLVLPLGDKKPSQVGTVGATHSPDKFHVIFKMRT